MAVIIAAVHAVAPKPVHLLICHGCLVRRAGDGAYCREPDDKRLILAGSGLAAFGSLLR